MDHPPAVREIAEYDCRRAGVHLNSAEFERLMEFVAARTHETAPQQLWQLAQSEQTSPGLLAVLLPDVWRNKLDDCALPLQAWREMFTVVPYTADRALTPRPGRGRWLYRGATAEHRDGLSWTTNHAIALYFATHRQHPGTSGTVWECFVPPHRMHAYLADEHEYIADVRDLPIVDCRHGRPRRMRLRVRPRVRRWPRGQADRLRSRPGIGA